jgi:hypothetical protein
MNPKKQIKSSSLALGLQSCLPYLLPGTLAAYLLLCLPGLSSRQLILAPVVLTIITVSYLSINQVLQFIIDHRHKS